MTSATRMARLRWAKAKGYLPVKSGYLPPKRATNPVSRHRAGRFASRDHHARPPLGAQAFRPFPGR